MSFEEKMCFKEESLDSPEQMEDESDMDEISNELPGPSSAIEVKRNIINIKHNLKIYTF